MMAHPHYRHLSKCLARLRHDGCLLDAEIRTSTGTVQLHKIILAIFSLHVKESNKDIESIWSVSGLGYTQAEVEHLVQLLYDGEVDIHNKCTEMIKSMRLDLSVDQRIRRSKISKSNKEQLEHVINLELKYLRNLTFEIEFPKLLNVEQKFTDVCIQTGIHQHRCHKVVLAAMSEYFAVMFASGMKESTDDTIKLQGIETETFSSVLNYIYTGRNPANITNAQELLSLAVYLQMKTLQCLCEEFLLQNIDVSNCVDILTFGGQHGCHTLTTGAMTYIVSHFNKINRLKLVRNLKMEDVVKLIADDNLSVTNENEVLSFVLDWILNNKSEAGLKTLLNHVRLAFVEEKYLEKLLTENNLLLTNKDCCMLLNEGIQQAKEGSVTVKARKEQAFVVLKRSSYLTGIDLACYSLSRKCWYQLQPLSATGGGTGFSASATDSHIYVTGGSATPRNFYQFSIDDNKWIELAELCEGRYSHAMACVNDAVYVLGGSGISTGTFDVVSSIEKYVIGKDAWIKVGKMTIPTFDSACAVVKTRILIFGGSLVEGGSTGAMCGAYIKDIQCFDTITETCSTLYHHLPFTLSLAVACTNNRDMYITCPNGKIVHYNEEGSPTAIDKNKGSQLMGFATVYHNSAIYILGGYSMVGESDAIHKFDLKTKQQLAFSETKVPFTRQTNQLYAAVMYVSRQHLDNEYHVNRELTPRRGTRSLQRRGLIV